MYGSEYSAEPQILLSSFGEMHTSYKKVANRNKKNLTTTLQKLYIKMFGIPEIGFQIRSLYFDKILNAHAKNKKFKKIIDAGSGIGMYTFWLARVFPKASIFGGEIDRQKLVFSSEFAKKINIGNVQFGYFDVTKPSKPSQYDFIVNIDVLEHIENYKSVLKNFSKLLSPRGFLFIHTPQPNQKRIFGSLKKWHHEDHVHEGFTPEDLQKELKKQGFKIITVHETFGLFGKLAWELNHISFKKGFVTAGVLFPLLYLIAKLDLVTNNEGNGLCTAILAKKK